MGKRITIWLKDEEWEWVKKKLETNYDTKSAVVRYAIRKAMNKERITSGV